MEDPRPDDSGHESERKPEEDRKKKIRNRFRLFPHTPSTFRAWTFGALGTFLCGFGGLYYNNRHIPPWLSLVIFLLGTVGYAYCFGQVALNHHRELRAAKWNFALTCLGGLVLVSVPFYYDYLKPDVPLPTQTEGRPPPDQLKLSRDMDDPIRRVLLIFSLAQTNKFDELRPLAGGVDVASIGSDGHAHGFKLTFKDADPKSSGVYAPVVCYQSKLEVEERIVRTQTLVLKRTNIFRIGIPLPFRQDEIPFKKLRDFHNANLVVYLCGNLTNKVKNIEFVVNGWAIFRKPAKGASWWRPVGDTWTLVSRKETKEMHGASGFDLTFDGDIPFYSELSGPSSPQDFADFSVLP